MQVSSAFYQSKTIHKKGRTGQMEKEDTYVPDRQELQRNPASERGDYSQKIREVKPQKEKKRVQRVNAWQFISGRRKSSLHAKSQDETRGE